VPPTATAIAGFQRAASNAKITGKLTILVNSDFHPDHNAFLRAEYSEYAKVNNWPVELSNIAGFQGGGDLNQKLLAGVQAGNAPDMMNHNVGAVQLQFLGTLEQVTDIATEQINKHGEPIPGMKDDLFFENQWWAVPFFTRAGGFYVRRDVFQKHGLDVDKDTETYDKLREAALKVSEPDNKMWGWGMTVNRSGDGNSMVQNVLFRFGSQLQDREGQRVTFNSPETIAGLRWLKETYTDQKWARMLPPGINSWTDPSNNEAFIAGTLAITDNAGTMYAKAVYDKVAHANQISWIERPMRLSDNRRLDVIGGARAYAIKGAKNKEANYDLMRHLLSDGVQQQIWRISPGYAMPAYKNQWRHELIQGNEISRRTEAAAYPSAPKDQLFTELRWPGPNNAAVAAIDAGNDYTDLMAEIIGGRAIEEVVKSYHDKFVGIYKQFGLRGA